MTKILTADEFANLPGTSQRVGTASPESINSKDHGGVLSFIVKELTGQNTGDTNIAGQVFRSTLGSEGAAGYGAQTAKIFYEAASDLLGKGINSKAKTLSDSLGGLAEQTQKLIQARRTITDEAQAARVDKLIQSNLETLSDGDSRIKDLLDQRGSLAKQTEAGINTALTAASGKGNFVKGGAEKALGKVSVGTLEKMPGLLPTAEKVLNAGKGVVPRAVEQAGIAAGFTASSNIGEGRPLTENVGASSVVGGSIPFAGTAVSKVADRFTAALTKGRDNASARIINSLIKPRIKDFSFGKNPGRAVAAEGIIFKDFEDGAKKITARKNEVGEAISEILSKSNKTTNLTDITAPIDAAIRRANEAPRSNATMITRLQNAKNDILGLQEGKIGDLDVSAQTRQLKDVPLVKAFELKKLVGDLVKWTDNNTEEKSINKAFKKVYSRIKEKIEDQEPTIKPLNERYADLLSAEHAVIYRDALSQRQNIFKFGTRVTGIGSLIASLFTGNPLPAIAGLSLAGFEEFMSTPRAKTLLASKLSTASKTERDQLVRNLPAIKSVVDRIFGEKQQLSQEEISTRLDQVLKTASSKAGLSIEDVSGGGFKNPAIGQIASGLSTKILSRLEGKGTVSRQFISDLTKQNNIKQVEKDIINKALEGEGNKIDSKAFVEKVQNELLPLERKSADVTKQTWHLGGYKYRDIVLPSELRGNVDSYKEFVYNSPVENTAGQIHFSSVEPKRRSGYFGHTRVEDMADNKTRRVIEVQSDLYQKDRFDATEIRGKIGQDRTEFNKLKTKILDDTASKEETLRYKELQKNLQAEIAKNRETLAQYDNPTAHFRMVREEIKKAAQDGKTVLQFPTGKTAMQIEGLGEGEAKVFTKSLKDYRTDEVYDQKNWKQVTQENLKIGSIVERNQDVWVITDIGKNGEYKMVTKDRWDDLSKGFADNVALTSYKESFNVNSGSDDPIYKFYENTLSKYLKNNYHATTVTDKQGVTWNQVRVEKKYAKMPVEAFGVLPLGFIPSEDKSNKQQEG